MSVIEEQSTMADTEKLMLFLILLFQFTSSTFLHNFTVNQTFRDGNLLVSEDKVFAFGFFSPGSSSNRYIGIWFCKVPENSVVWVANRNDPIMGSSGFLSVNQYCNLVLFSNRLEKVPIWSANVTVRDPDSCRLQLLDSGNLVLIQGRRNRIVWQSFDYPTDTFLAGMRLGKIPKSGLHWKLISWRSENDPGIGDYTLELDTRGTAQFVVYKGSRVYWRSSPWPWRKFSNIYNYSIVYNQHGRLHKKDENEWKEMWNAPEYRCDLYGKCGGSSKCAPSNPDTFACSCLPGFEPKSLRDWQLRDGSGGCVRKRDDSSLLCGHGEGFVKVENVKLPDTSVATWADMNISRMGCEWICKKNCTCNAYASVDFDGKGSGCLVWYGQLWDTVYHVYEPYDLYVRVDAVELAEYARMSNDFNKKEIKILIISIVSAWCTLIFSAYLWFRRRRKGSKRSSENRVFDRTSGSNNYKNNLMASDFGSNSQPLDVTFFDLDMIIAATNSFSPANKLGHGGFGTVYKGQLFDGQEVAVKRLAKNSMQGMEEFKNEIMLTAKLQHKNLVKLLGCCIEGGEQMLIYEYLTNKSLDSILFDQTRKTELDWRKRFNIITGTARGILYLHQDSRLKIIHRDLKSSNILLDVEMNPKISDFGMARIFKADQTQEKTNRVVGTYGYMSPEYAVFGRFSEKSDVFSFGVILLEIISGKKSNDYMLEEFSFSLIGQVWELWKKDNVLEIVDPKLEEESYPTNQVLRCIQIGLLCVEENATDRPTMLEVALMLGSETSLPCPKKPAFVCIGEVEEGSNSINELTITTSVAR